MNEDTRPGDGDARQPPQSKITSGSGLLLAGVSTTSRPGMVGRALRQPDTTRLAALRDLTLALAMTWRFRRPRRLARIRPTAGSTIFS